MSEFQGYAFQTVDRPLTPEQMEELRAVSSRADITPTHFSNFYTYGNFRGDERDMMTRYFDAFVYVANWGTHRLMFRLPAELFDLTAAGAYETDSTVSVSRAGKGVVLVELAADEEGGEWLEEDDADQWLSVLLPLREDLLNGDLRALYLGWLAGLEQGEVEDDAEEPPVPPGLASLSGPLRELAGFLYIDEDLLSVAAEASRAGARAAPPEEMAEWVRALAAREKDDLLLSLMSGEAPHLGRTLLRRFQQERPRKRAEEAGARRRTAGALRRAWEHRGEVERQREEEEAARERQRRERAAAERRDREFEALAGQEGRLWREVEEAVSSRLPKRYDEAVSRLKDLREFAGRSKQEAAFLARLRSLREAHTAKRTFLQRLDKAGLTG